MLVNLLDMFEQLNSEIIGELIAAHPDVESTPEGPFEEQGVWIVSESIAGDRSSRNIVFRPREGKVIEEEEGPFAIGCPLYFFELVPFVKNQFWRNRVKWFASLFELSEVEFDQAWEAFEAGQEAFENHIEENENPYSGEIARAWFMGWASCAHLALPEDFWPDALRDLT